MTSSITEIVEALGRPLTFTETNALAVVGRIYSEAQQRLNERAFDLRQEAAVLRRRAEIAGMDIFAMDWQESHYEWHETSS